MSHARMIVLPVLISKLCPFDDFPQNSCTTHYSVTVWDIIMTLYRNLNSGKTMCPVQLWLISVSELWPYGCVCICMVILSNLHSCTLHNSRIVHDIFTLFNKNVY